MTGVDDLLDDIRERCAALIVSVDRIAEIDRKPMPARDLLAVYRRRARVFAGTGATLDDPSWIMLLDLYVRPPFSVSISSACLASLAPPTTALRHIRHLIRIGLVEREASAIDTRKSHLRLTTAGIAAIEAALIA